MAVLHANGSDLAEVSRLAGEADVVLVVAGSRHDEVGEYISDEQGLRPNGPEQKKPLTLFDKEKREPAFPFGHGLSYTTYAYKNLSVATPKVAPDGRVAVSVDVTNTGKRAGEEIVQPILPRCRPAESTVHGRRRGGSSRLRDRFAWQQIVARTGDGADHNQDDPSTTKDGESGH